MDKQNQPVHKRYACIRDHTVEILHYAMDTSGHLEWGAMHTTHATYQPGSLSGYLYAHKRHVQLSWSKHLHLLMQRPIDGLHSLAMQ